MTRLWWQATIWWCLTSAAIGDADFDIFINCVANCGRTKLVNPSKPVIMNVECKGRWLRVKYEWALRPDVANVKKQFLRNETIGADALTFIIKRDVLLPKENYYVTVTATEASTNTKKQRAILLQTEKCSKKYPCGGETSADYVDSAPERPASRAKALADIEEEAQAQQSEDILQARARKSLLLSDIKYLPLNNSQDVQRAAKLVQHIVHTGGAALTPNVLRSASEANENIVNAELELIQKAQEPEVLQAHVKQVANTVLSSVPHIINESKSELASHRPATREVENMSLIEEVPYAQNYPVYDEFDVVYQAKKKNMEAASMNTVSTVNKLARASALTMGKAASTVEIVTDNACILNIRADPEALKGRSFEVCGATLHFADTLPIALRSGDNKKWLITFSLLKKNPYWWADAHVSSDVISLEFRSSARQIISGRTESPVEFYLNVKRVETEVVKGACTIPADNIDELADDAIAVHQIYAVDDIDMLIIQFENVAAKHELQVVVTKGRRPSRHSFRYAYTIPRQGDAAEKFTIMEAVSIRAYTKCYVGVYPTRSAILQSGTLRNNNYQYNYSVQFWSGSCNRWSGYSSMWLRSECKVGPQTTLKRIHCRCMHLSSFAASVSAVESKQDAVLHVPLQLRRQHCHVVPITAGAVLTVCLVALIYACAKDHKRFKPRKVRLLLDNNLANTYKYVVAVYTSSQRHSGSTANIGFKIYGSDGATDVHALFGFEKPILQSGADDWFLLLTSSALGELRTLELWTDCYGSRSSWYCRKVIVYDLQDNAKWIFNVDCWLSVLSNTTFCSTEASSAITEQRGTKWHPMKRALAKTHLWFSFFKKCLARGHLKVSRRAHLQCLRRPRQPAFTAVERAAVMLSVYVVIMFVALLLYGVPTPELYYSLDARPFQPGMQDVGIALASALVAFVLCYSLTHVFTHAHPMRPTTLTQHFTYHVWKGWRPVAWFGIVALNVPLFAILIMFGRWTGYYSSLLWLLSVTLSIMICIFLLESMRVAVLAIWKPEASFPYIDKHLDLSDVEPQRTFLLKTYGETSMRPYFSKLYKRLAEPETKVILEKELQRSELRQLVVDIITFLCYLLILCHVVVVHRDRLAYYSTRNIESMFIKDHYIGNMSFEEINSQGRLYRYLRVTFLPAMHATMWYGNFGTNETGLTVNFNTKLLGIPRLRQIRIREESCTVSKAMRFVARECNAEYSAGIEERRDFSPRWQPPTNRTARSSNELVWHYKSGAESQSSYVFGELAVYPGGGYLAYLGRTRQNAELVLQYLENANWVDARTRAVFIETVFYNANCNLFNLLTLVVEKSATGKYIPKYSIRTAKFLLLYSELQIRSYVTFIVFVLMTLVFTWRKLRLLRDTSFKSFVADAWNVVDLAVVALAFGFIFASYARTEAVSRLMQVLQLAAHNEFVSFSRALHWDDFVNLVGTGLVAVATVRVWKLLRFARMFRVLELTLHLAAKYLVAMMCVELLVVFAFSVTGLLIFGPYSFDFRSVFHTLVSLILLGFGFNGRFEYGALDEAYGSIGYWYYVCYMVALLITVNLFVTIIVVAYENAKDYFDESEYEQSQSYNLRNFLREELQYLTSKTKGRQVWGRTTQECGVQRDAVRNGPRANVDAPCDTITLKAGRVQAMLRIACASLEAMASKDYAAAELQANMAKLLTVCLESEGAVDVSGDADTDGGECDVYFRISYADRHEYCAKRRLEEMLAIVNYVGGREARRAAVGARKPLDVSSLLATNRMLDSLSSRLEDVTEVKYSDKSTAVTFEELGLQLSEEGSSSE